MISVDSTRLDLGWINYSFKKCSLYLQWEKFFRMLPKVHLSSSFSVSPLWSSLFFTQLTWISSHHATPSSWCPVSLRRWSVISQYISLISFAPSLTLLSLLPPLQPHNVFNSSKMSFNFQPVDVYLQDCHHTEFLFPHPVQLANSYFFHWNVTSSERSLESFSFPWHRPSVTIMNILWFHS